MTPASSTAFIQFCEHACVTAYAREQGADNVFAGKSEKELAKIVVDAMASAAAQKKHLGKAVVALLGRKRK